MQWIKRNPMSWTFSMRCSNCGLTYSPRGYEDGTTDASYRFCPKCGESTNRLPKRSKQRRD